MRGKKGSQAPCLANGCTRRSYSLGLCNAHYLRHKRGRPQDRPLRKMQGLWSRLGPREYTLRWRWARRQALVEFLGNKCARCGGTFHPAVYDFHHKDPTTKKFNISLKLAYLSLEILTAEAEKCELLCANCHRLRHWGVSDEVLQEKDSFVLA